MTKIFLLGNDSINSEIKSLFQNKAVITEELGNADLIIDSSNFPKEQKIENLKLIEETSKAIPVLTSSLCVSVAELSKHSKYPKKLIGIGLYNTFSHAKMLEIAPSKITDTAILKNAENFLSSTGLKYSIVPDKAGMVFPRVVSMIINEAAQVYAEKIASKEDIDTAMKLGTNYPNGPLEWADKIGLDLIYNILSAMEADFGEERYKPHPSLKEMIDAKKKFYS